MSKSIYIVARHFEPNSGSYAGFIEEVSKYAHSKGYKIKILAAKIKKSLPEREKLDYAEVIRFPVPIFRVPLLGSNLDYIALSYKVKAYFKRNKPNIEDIILANTCAALGLKGHKYFLRTGQPALVFLKNMEIAKKEVSLPTRIARFIHYTFQFFLEKKCAKYAYGAIYPSFETRNHNIRYYGGKEKAYFVPHSGVKYNDLQNGKKIDINGRVLLFVSAGTEKIRKGIIYLEKALPEIFLKHKDVKLLHVGEKFEWGVPDWCQKRIVSVGKVSWEKMKDYYASADIMLMCSLNEGMANALFEAMAYGLPVVTSDIDGIKEFISHEKDGFIYKRGDISGIVNGVEFILKNKNFRKKAKLLLKEKAKKIDYSKYSEELLNFLELPDNKNLIGSK